VKRFDGWNKHLLVRQFPGWHAGVSDAVADMIENFAIGRRAARLKACLAACRVHPPFAGSRVARHSTAN
jgi:hypothetical protein